MTTKKNRAAEFGECRIQCRAAEGAEGNDAREIIEVIVDGVADAVRMCGASLDLIDRPSVTVPSHRCPPWVSLGATLVN